MFTTTFSTGNAAFGETYASEIERILQNIAERIHQGESRGTLYDHNGNMVGTFELQDTAEPR